jgi:hypothetical protein
VLQCRCLMRSDVSDPDYAYSYHDDRANACPPDEAHSREESPPA